MLVNAGPPGLVRHLNAELTQYHIMTIPSLDIVLQLELVDNVGSSRAVSSFLFPITLRYPLGLPKVGEPWPSDVLQ